MKDFLPEMFEFTSSWHWRAYYGYDLEAINKLMTDQFTSIQEHHRIEVVSTALNTILLDNGDPYFSILVAFKRYDKI